MTATEPIFQINYRFVDRLLEALHLVVSICQSTVKTLLKDTIKISAFVRDSLALVSDFFNGAINFRFELVKLLCD